MDYTYTLGNHGNQPGFTARQQGVGYSVGQNVSGGLDDAGSGINAPDPTRNNGAHAGGNRSRPRQMLSQVPNLIKIVRQMSGQVLPMENLVKHKQEQINSFPINNIILSSRKILRNFFQIG